MAEDTFGFGVGKENRPVTVRGWDGLFAWLQRERAHWDWLERGGETDLPNNLATNVLNRWDQIFSSLHQLKNQGYQVNQAVNDLQHIGPHGQLLVSTSTNGAQVLDIRESAGDLAGAFAYAFLLGILQWQSVSRPEGLLGVLLTVIPDMREPSEVTARLKQERSHFRNAIRSGIARLEKEFREREAKFDALVKRGTGLALETLRVRKAEWEEAQERWSDTASDAVSQINSVRDTFLQYMQLRAPVEYWNQKSKEHEAAAVKLRKNLQAYFVVFILLMALAFGISGNFIINQDDRDVSGSITAIYFILSAGLAVLSTIGFWIGKLLTKLYLSERHLKTDADERAVMTKTYLALTKENSSTDSERQIILAALFRSISDGIVRDDGPPDIGLQTIVSKALAK